MKSCVDEFREEMAEVNTKLDSLQRKRAVVGSKGDDAMLRQEIQNDILSIKSSVSKISDSLKRIDAEKHVDAETCNNAFNELALRIQNELKTTMSNIKSSHPQEESSSPKVSSMATPLFDQVLLDDEQTQIEIMEQEVLEILNSMKEIQTLFTKVFTELQKQRNLVVLVDSEVGDAKDRMENGNDELNIASLRQKQTTKKLLWFLLIVLIICGAIALFIYLIVPNDPKPTPSTSPTHPPAVTNMN